MAEASTFGPLVAVAGLTHRFGSRAALVNLSLEVGRGEILGLLGPNGSGKSTLLAVLAGLLPRQVGTLTFDGRPMLSADFAFRRRIGMVFQHPSLDRTLTCRENILLALRMHGIRGADARERAARLLEEAGLGDRGRDPAGTLSGGMQRRLDLARALAHEPSLLLMDEPTAGLDEAAYQRTWEQLLAQRAAFGSSVLLTTHRPDEAARADRLLVLSRGRAVVSGTPEALIRRVAGDVITVTGDDPLTIADEIRARFALAPRVEGNDVYVTCDAGHELLVRLVEAFAPGRLTSLNLRRPTLADVFLALTGHELDRDEEATASDLEIAA